MRAAPAVAVMIARSAWWLRATAALGLLVIAATLRWAWSEPDSLLRWAVCAAAGAWAIWVLRQELRTGLVGLRWDGQCWHLQRASPATAEPVRGEVDVMLDFGHWMLLRFRPADLPRPRRTWIAAQRSDLEVDWHPLRCAVYSPRPSLQPRAVEADASLPASPPP